MSSKNKTRIGIEISFNVIKMTYFTIMGKAVSENYQVPLGINRTQFLDFIKSSVSNFIKANNLKSVSFNFTISYDENNGRINFISIPKMDKKNLGKAMKYEIQDKNEEENLDNFHILSEKVSENADTNKISFANVIIKKDLIAALSSLKKVSWTIESLEIKPISIGRFIKDNSIVIDYGRRSTFVYYYKDGVMMDISPIPSGWLRINEIIEEIQPGSTPEQMEEIKKRLFLYDESQNYPPPALNWDKPEEDVEININDLSNLEDGVDKDVLMEISLRTTQEIRYITEEIKRLIRSFELNQDVLVNKLYFIGDTSNFDDFLKLFSDELQIDTYPLSKLLSEINKPVEEEGFSVSALASLYADEKYFRSLNFEKFIKNNYDIGSLFVASVILAVLLHGGMAHIHKLYDERTEEYRAKVVAQENEISNIDMEIQQAREKERQLGDITAWLDGIDNERVRLSEFFYHLPNITPNGVAFNKITVQNGLITLRGYARNYSNVGFLAMELEKLGGITIEDITKKNTGDGEGESGSQVTIENILDGGAKETFNTTNSFTIKINAAFPIANYNND